MARDEAYIMSWPDEGFLKGFEGISGYKQGTLRDSCPGDSGGARERVGDSLHVGARLVRDNARLVITWPCPDPILQVRRRNTSQLNDRGEGGERTTCLLSDDCLMISDDSYVLTRL